MVTQNTACFLLITFDKLWKSVEWGGKKQNKTKSQELLGSIIETSEISVQELLG